MELPITLGHSESWTVLGLLERGSEVLLARGFEEAHLHAELLLTYALGISTHQLLAHPERAIRAGEADAFWRLLARRLTHEPLQYIVGETEFMGIPILVDRRVLIPRPETEILVEQAANWLGSRGRSSLRVLDVGTGSGCIAIALARSSPQSDIVGLDISSDALAVAGLNVARQQITSVRLVCGDIFADPLPGEMFDCIVANPPYVTAADYEQLQPEVRDFEPRIATTDGADGLRFARRIAGFAADRLGGGGSLFMEIGFGLRRQVSQIVRDAGLSDISVFPDLGGIDRVVSAKRPE